MSAFTTMYFGHSIRIEPSEWGYLAHIEEAGTDRHLVAASASALTALEKAFDAIDEAVKLDVAVTSARSVQV